MDHLIRLPPIKMQSHREAALNPDFKWDPEIYFDLRY